MINLEVCHSVKLMLKKAQLKKSSCRFPQISLASESFLALQHSKA